MGFTTAVASSGPLFLPRKTNQCSIAAAMPENRLQMGVKKQTVLIQRRNPTITLCLSTMWNGTHMTTAVLLLPLIGGNSMAGVTCVCFLNALAMDALSHRMHRSSFEVEEA